MRGPVHRFDQVEADIEDTRRFLKGYVESETWEADPDMRAISMHSTIAEVEISNLPDWAKGFAILALLGQTKKRRGKPRRQYRNNKIRSAAERLVMRGYMPTRNDVTRDRASASSIIHQALCRLGEKSSEKSINAVVAKHCAWLKDIIDKPDKYKRANPEFYELVLKYFAD